MTNNPNTPAAHTPTPYKIEKYDENKWYVAAVEPRVGETSIVARCTTEANAAFICRAVNCHSELVEVLEEVLNHPKMAFDNGPEETITIHDKIVRLLARARGQAEI